MATFFKCAGAKFPSHVQANAASSLAETSMATNEQLIQALVQALAVVLNRQPTPDERQLLIKHFDASSGTTFERAETAITKTANVQKRVLLEKSAASDDADRVMQDLKRIASQWKPSK